MPLQSSGAISLLNIQNEFGGSPPISISEYYNAASGVPGSGSINLAHFYGKVKPLTFNVTQDQCMDHYATLYYDGAGNFYIQSKEPSGAIHTWRGDCGNPQGQIFYYGFNVNGGYTTMNFTVTQNGRNGYSAYTGSNWSVFSSRTQDLGVIDGSGGAAGYTFNIYGTIS